MTTPYTRYQWMNVYLYGCASARYMIFIDSRWHLITMLMLIVAAFSWRYGTQSNGNFRCMLSIAITNLTGTTALSPWVFMFNYWSLWHEYILDFLNQRLVADWFSNKPAMPFNSTTKQWRLSPSPICLMWKSQSNYQTRRSWMWIEMYFKYP